MSNQFKQEAKPNDIIVIHLHTLSQATMHETQEASMKAARKSLEICFNKNSIIHIA